MTPHDRAWVTASLYGVAPKDPSDLVIRDAARVDLGRADDQVVAILVASTSASHLHTATKGVQTSGADAYARAAQWCNARSSSSSSSSSPCITPSQLRVLVRKAADAGLVLVEPELPPSMRKILPARAPIDRAIVSLITRGEHVLLFVPRARAPKNGLAKLREDRILDFWLAAATVSKPASWSSPLTAAAFAVLAEAKTPLRGKDLLREARTRHGSANTSDGPSLAKDLVLAWMNEALLAYPIAPTE